MGRRRKDSGEEIITAVGALICFGIFFVPGFKMYLYFAAALVLVGIAALLIYLLLKHRTAPLTLDRPSVSEFLSPSVPAAPPYQPTLSDKLRRIDWFQFEKLIAALYQSKGYRVTRLGGANPDGGIDLIAENEGEKFIVQCKQWKKWKVGVKQIREFLGTLTDSKISRGVFITLQGYTPDAVDFAARHNIELLDENATIALLDQANRKYNPAILSALNDSTKRCPKCESEMVLRTAAKGSNVGEKFWGCSRYPRCRFILNL